VAPPPLGRLLPVARRLKQLADSEARARAHRAPLQQHTVLYESFGGNGLLCNPEAIFRGLLDADGLQHLRHVWALTDPGAYRDSTAEFASHPRVSVVRRGSRSYYRTLATAKYLVNNATFPQPFSKRDGQVYLNTWHGTPIKAMGYDVPGGAFAARNVVRNLVCADYLLAPNDDTAAMYLHAYRMTNAFEGRLLDVGTPRIDRQFGSDRAVVSDRLAAQGIKLDPDAEVVLYAPTWRGDFDRPDGDIAQLREVVDALRARADRRNQVVLLKVHERAYAHAQRHPGLRGTLVPNAIPTNELLAGTDVLITDYSSVWVDFLATGRPMLFYAPDLDEYVAERHVNLAPEHWPGPVARTVDELAAHLHEVAGAREPLASYAERYAAARTRFCPHEDAAATERVIDIVFRDAAGAAGAVRAGARDGRTRLLVHLGSLQPNGITSAALALLRTIDHHRYDVSAWYAQTGTAGQLDMARQIDPRVRLFVLPPWLTGSKVRVRAQIALARLSRAGRRALAAGSRELMRAEWTRAFGASRYEHVIDFSGYEPYWIKLLTARPGGSLSIWLHNDIAAELTNPRRSRRLRSRLRGAAALFGRADHLVSVSRALCEVNAAGLGAWASHERFGYARNTIDAARILGAAGDAAPSAAPTFISVGRLSAEKNHLRLIQAFRIVHDAHPATRLVIVGDGPLLGELRAAVAQLGLDGAVELTGHQPNPYPAMRAAGCFVLSSDYEGQPVVLLEALVLGLPIVVTRFGSVDDTLPAGSGLVVEREVDALAAGMQRFLDGDVPRTTFDAARYNDEVIAEFYRAIDAEPDTEAGAGGEAAAPPPTW
jgi:CDP-glycerol glycerophosphotransferase (TagB/SpsB family)